MKRQSGRKIIFVIFLLFITFVSSATAQSRKVRVGFFHFPGYHDITALKERTGYGYELLQLMNRYNDWEYEYVGYDKSWSQVQQMLANGELDLLTSAQKTAKRESEYDFSELAVGSSYTILSVKDGNKRFVEGNYQSYNNMRVGMIRGNTRNASFARFAASHNFTYIPVYYDDTVALTADLQAGKNVDAIVTSNLRKVVNEWVLERFDPAPFYAMVRKGDTELLQEVNNALTRMDIDMPGWRTDLSNKFYTVKNGDNLSFNKAERDYLQEIQEQHKIFSVLVNPDRAPYSYFEKGEAKGIVPRIFREIASRVGIEYKFVEVKSREEYIKLSESDDVDIVLDSPYDFYWAETYHFRLSQPYLETAWSALTRKKEQDNHGKYKRIGILAENEYIVRKLLATKIKQKPIIYPDVKSGVEALNNDLVDELLLFTYTAQKVMAEDERNTLQMTIIPAYSIRFALALDKHNSYLLNNVLNKGVQSMLHGATDNIILDEITSFQERATFISFIYDQPFVALAVVTILIALAAGLILSMQHSQNAEREKQLAEAAKKVDEAKNRVLQDALVTAEQASETKGNFLSRMSHEIRTPLNAVLGFLDLAKMEQNSPDQVNGYVDKCMIAAKQLLAIINDVLDMSAIERGKMRLAQESYNMGTLLEETEGLFISQARSKGIVFNVATAKVADLTVIGDQLRLKQVLVNLLSNAVKFTDKGGSVQLKADYSDTAGNKVRVKFDIIDNGIGMDPAFLAHLFEPFNQASATTAQKYGGSGLGLSITKNLVTMMQGSLDVVSAPGKGSTFTVVLTLPRGDKRALAQSSDDAVREQTLAMSGDLAGLRVLLVEDNVVNREIAKRLLDKVGAVVTTVDNGKKAVDTFLQTKPGTIQLILMDIQMPVMDGYEATKQIRTSEHPDAKNVPIVAMTANAFNEDVGAALAAGMNGHLAKPIDLRAFNRILHEAKDKKD